MDCPRAALAAAAEALVGTPFRLHGRDPQTGLDCIGLYTAARAAIGRPVNIPPCYGLRNRDIAGILARAGTDGLTNAQGLILAGDVVLTRFSPIQVHLLVAVVGNRFVHAHAGLRRVVTMPGPLALPLISHWRLTDPS